MTSGVYIRTDWHRKRISESHKGITPVNKGIPMSLEQREKLKESWKSRPPFSEDHIIRLKTMNIGRKHSDLAKAKMSLAQRGENNPSWKGGISPMRVRIWQSARYKNWRKEVFLRDDYTCKMCGSRGRKIQADHIKPFSRYPELRFDITNGRTLCVSCHKNTDTYAGRAIKYKSL